MPAYRAPDFSFLGSHTRGSPQCRQYRRCYRGNQLHDEFYGFFLCHDTVYLRLILYLSSRPSGSLSLSFRPSTSSPSLSSRPSEARGEISPMRLWAQAAKPQRFLDSARNDRWGLYARHDRVGVYARNDKFFSILLKVC